MKKATILYFISMLCITTLAPNSYAKVTDGPGKAIDDRTKLPGIIADRLKKGLTLNITNRTNHDIIALLSQKRCVRKAPSEILIKKGKHLSFNDFALDRRINCKGRTSFIEYNMYSAPDDESEILGKNYIYSHYMSTKLGHSQKTIRRGMNGGAINRKFIVRQNGVVEHKPIIKPGVEPNTPIWYKY